MGQDSSVSKATGHVSFDRVSNPGGNKEVSSRRQLQTGYSIYPVAYTIVTRHKANEAVKLTTHFHLVPR
jgi:hypothetical protein